MGRKGRWSGIVVIAGCVLSLAGVRPVRWLEQLPAPVLAPFDRLAAGWLPPPGDTGLVVLRAPAKAAWAAYERSVLGEVPVSAEGREGLLVPVVERHRDRHELVLAVPPDAVPEGVAVTHRGVLLGFVRDATSRPGRAVVSLLGQDDARPVAAQWSATPEGRQVQFLVQSAGRREQYAVRVAALTSRVLPPPDQFAWTRDVSELGDALPPGLLLGRLAGGTSEAPGGGAWFDAADTLRLSPLIDPFGLGVVTVEILPGAELPLRRGSARLSPTSTSDRAARLRAGSRAGVRRGDWVCQAGLYVGVVVELSPWSALLDTAAPDGRVLVVSPDGRGVACTPSRSDWPHGWEPVPGDLVATGQVGTGGLVLGTVDRVDEDGLAIRRLLPDARLPVTVVGP